MTKFVRNSRLRRVVSTMMTVAMLASLVVMPAYAAETGAITSTNLPAAGFTAAVGSYDRGVQGSLSVSTTGTPAMQAEQQSVDTYLDAAAKGQTLGGGGANALGVQDYTFYVSVWSPDFGEDAAYVGSEVSTRVAVPASVGTTVGALVDSLDAVLGALPYQLAGDAYFTSGGKIRIVKRYAEFDSEIWVHSSTDPNDPTTDPFGVLSVAEAVMGANLDPLFLGFSWGRLSPYSDTYKVGTDNNYAAIEATWTPLNGTAIGSLGAGFELGSFDNGIIGNDNFVSAPDTSTGLYTAVRSLGWPGGYVLLSTAGRSSAVDDGTAVVTFGNGARDAAYDVDCGITVLPSVDPTAGAVTTWTVNVPAPDATTGTWNGSENAYNGVSVLFPKEFVGVNGPNHASFLTALVASFGTTPTVTTSATAEGYLVTLSNFVSSGPLSFQTALQAATTAGDSSVGAKVWIHNVGTPWTADPTVTSLIDARYPDAGTDWYPVFCECGTEDMWITPDLLNTVSLGADVNRAEGYTALVATAKDKFGNDVAGYTTFSGLTITGLADGANLAAYGAGEWIWQYAKTPGVNTASLVADDSRTVANEALAATVSRNTSGIGEPAKVRILSDKDTFLPGEDPGFQIQLLDANDNPTSWLDKHESWDGGPSTDWFEVNAHSQNNPFPFGLGTENVYVWRGWSKSTGMAFGANTLFGTDTTGLNAWPQGFGFGMTADGPDTWTLSTKHRSGSVLPATFKTVDILAEDPAVAGVPVGFKVTATKKAPAAYADGDDFYNNKFDEFADDAFGYAAAGGVDSVLLEARVVDAYGNTITNGTAGIPVTFDTPKFDRSNAILPTGHTYETTTNAQGVASVMVKSFEPTLSRRNVPGTIGGTDWQVNDSSWFTPVRARTTVFFGGTDWANPCGDTEDFAGFGFTYFHGARMTAELEETPEGFDNDVLLADGVDDTMYNVSVIDSAFNTPIPNWDVKFTTSFGTFADGSSAVTMTTDANGAASVAVKSSNAGRAYLRTFDRWRNAFTTAVDFTDYATKFTVNDATKRAGDRAFASVTAWAENIKTGARVEFDDADYDWVYDGVYGYDTENTHGDGVNAVQETNDIVFVDFADADNDDRADGVNFLIPAYDDSGIKFESAGKRYAMVGGSFTTSSWFNNVFYDELEFVAAPARPEVDFVKEATLKAEGTQLSEGMSLVGAGFTPGSDYRGPSNYTDYVDVYLGDITKGNAEFLGMGYVGNDGVLLPTAVAAGLGRLSPGMYDITVDGLVFKQGLVIKDLFGSVSPYVLNAEDYTGGVFYLKAQTNYELNVGAYGADEVEVWVGDTKLARSTTTGMFILPTSRMQPGLRTLTARVTWNTDSGMNAKDSYNGPYTTVVTQKVYVQKSMVMTQPTISASGRTLSVRGRVAAPAEANGSKQFLMKVAVQKLINGRWRAYTTRFVRTNGASANTFLSQVRVGSAGTYRAVVSHGDVAHPMVSKTTARKAVR